MACVGVERGEGGIHPSTPRSGRKRAAAKGSSSLSRRPLLKEDPLAAMVQSSLFSWDALEARSDLDRLHLVRDYLPDERLVHYLEVMRGHGRDDDPVRAMWNALLAGIVYQHERLESLLRELARNPSLMQACGFDPLPIQRPPKPRVVTDPNTGVVRREIPPAAEPVRAVPSSWNFSRFLANVIELEDALGMVSEMAVILRESLMAVLPDFGQHLGFDGTDIASHSTGRKERTRAQTSDPDADWGDHETQGVDARTAKAWKKLKTWFGYGLHLIADTHYEIPVAFEVTPASVSEQPTLRALIRATFSETPQLAERGRDFSADRGLDSAETKALLWDAYAIRPLIDTRELWREEKRLPDYDPAKPVTRPLDPERADTLVYTEKGAVHCVCPVSGEQRDLAFQGFEADRNTLK